MEVDLVDSSKTRSLNYMKYIAVHTTMSNQCSSDMCRDSTLPVSTCRLFVQRDFKGTNLSSSLMRLLVTLGKRRCRPDFDWDGTHKLTADNKGSTKSESQHLV